MVWRFLETKDVPEEFTWWWWTFYMVEVFLLFAIWLGHSQRLFAVQRVRTTMDQIVSVRRVRGGMRAEISFMARLGGAGELLLAPRYIVKKNVNRSRGEG